MLQKYAILVQRNPLISETESMFKYLRTLVKSFVSISMKMNAKIHSFKILQTQNYSVP